MLIVEDRRLSIELFRAVLEADGHELVVEMDGIRGRDRARAERFDLVLLDVQLPGLSGPEVCRELRAGGYARPILALSSSAMPEEIAAGRDAGFDDYLTKPIAPATLRAAVREHGAKADRP